jgi:hypothetical protein
MLVKVKDLQIGDVLTGGEIIAARPFPEDNPREGKNKMRVTLALPPGSRYNVETRVWGKYTDIGVVNRATWPQVKVEDLVLGAAYTLCNKGADLVYIFKGLDMGGRPVFVGVNGLAAFSKKFQTIPVKPVL